MADQPTGVTRLQLLDALRAGPLDNDHVIERFGVWPKEMVAELKRQGLIVTSRTAMDVTIQLTPRGQAWLPSRRSLARTHWLDEGVA
jgi:hypothetical protein